MASNTSPYQPADDPLHDCGPWMETPASSRVRDYRFDYKGGGNGVGQLQVRWRNRPPTQGYVYDCDRHTYMNFARAVSKGKQVNRALNGLSYRPADYDELLAPTNPARKALASRVHNTGNMSGRDQARWQDEFRGSVPYRRGQYIQPKSDQ